MEPKLRANLLKKPETRVLPLFPSNLHWNSAVALQLHVFNLLLQHLIILPQRVKSVG